MEHLEYIAGNSGTGVDAAELAHTPGEAGQLIVSGGTIQAPMTNAAIRVVGGKARRLRCKEQPVAWRD